MFENTGKKIKGIASAVFWVNVVISVLVGLILIPVLGAFEERSAQGLVVLICLVIIAIGIFFAWLGTIMLYSYGELVETNQIIARKITEADHNTVFWVPDTHIENPQAPITPENPKELFDDLPDL